MSLITVGIAFIVAAAPFLLFLFIGMFFAWTIGVMMVGIPIFALTIAWSILYLLVFEANAGGHTASTLSASNKDRYVMVALCGVPGIVAVGFAFLSLR